MYINRRDENVRLLGSPLLVNVNVGASVDVDANVKERCNLKHPIYTNFTNLAVRLYRDTVMRGHDIASVRRGLPNLPLDRIMIRS